MKKFKVPQFKLKDNRGIRAVIIIVILLMLLKANIYHVSEQEQAILTRFGKVVDVKTAGIYAKIPFIEHVTTVNTTTHGMAIGYETYNETEGVNPESEYVDTDSLMITSDFNFVNVDFYLEYRVSDPVKYIYNSYEAEEILNNLAQAAIRATVVNFPVDDVMTTGKSKIQAAVKETLIEDLEEADIGLSVVNISIQDVEPPTAEVLAAFKAVENAKQGSQTAVNNAKKYESEEIPKAEAEADKIRQIAEAKKESRIAEAKGQSERFRKIYAQYSLNPEITKRRLFYETMEDILPDLKVIVDDGNVQKILPLDPIIEEYKVKEEKAND